MNKKDISLTGIFEVKDPHIGSTIGQLPRDGEDFYSLHSEYINKIIKDMKDRINDPDVYDPDSYKKSFNKSIDKKSEVIKSNGSVMEYKIINQGDDIPIKLVGTKLKVMYKDINNVVVIKDVYVNSINGRVSIEALDTGLTSKLMIIPRNSSLDKTIQELLK